MSKASRSPQFLARRDELAAEAGVARAIAQADKADQDKFNHDTPEARAARRVKARAAKQRHDDRELALTVKFVLAACERWEPHLSAAVHQFLVLRAAHAERKTWGIERFWKGDA